MNKTILFKEIHKELERLNNEIDSKIIKGRSYDKEARRHKTLIATLMRIASESEENAIKRRSRFGKSPVRRQLDRGVLSRLLPWNFA